MAFKPISEPTSCKLVLHEEEKLIIRKYQRNYEEIYNERPSTPTAVADIIREWDELKNKK